MSNKFTRYILIAMVLGVVMGALIYQYLPGDRADIASDVNLIAMLFLRLIKMIIAPLVFATLVGGIAHMGSGSRLGRIFAKTMGWFVSASFISLLLGLVMVNMLQPGANFPGTLPDKGQVDRPARSRPSRSRSSLTHLIPTSIADAMATNEILQIVVFAVFFAVAMGAMPERSKRMLVLIEDLGHIMLKLTSYVMLFAPLAVWAAITATVAKNGLLVLWKLVVFMGGFYFSLFILWGILVIVGFIVIGPRYRQLLALIREPLMIAFSTASSEAAYPKTLEGLNKFGASARISSFVLPLGYSFNLDGTMMYCTFASIFIAQSYHVEMSLGTQFAMLATLMLTSKGMAGVPRASLVVIAATLGQFNIPEAGLLMIMGIDTFLDMGRSATNVIGNSAGHVGRRQGGRRARARARDGTRRCRPAWHRTGRPGGRLMGRLALAAGWLLAAALVPAVPQAQEAGLSPTLAAIKAAHAVRLGYRESSPPFSFLDQSNRPIGYSLELCAAIVEEIGAVVDDADLRIDYIKVTSDDRIAAVVDNKIDLECGSTTANFERGKQVAFSPLMFVAGTKLMVAMASAATGIADLKGKAIVVTKGTTNEQAIHAADARQGLGLRIVTGADHEQSYQMLADGKVDAFATDDILLYGLIARHKAQERMKVVGDYLSYDPYGIMFRKGEPELAAAVERAFRRLATNHDLLPLYRKWFVARLPTGEKLNVAISPQLEESFRVLDESGSSDN